MVEVTGMTTLRQHRHFVGSYMPDLRTTKPTYWVSAQNNPIIMAQISLNLDVTRRHLQNLIIIL
jgi:hypothetical protein